MGMCWQENAPMSAISFLLINNTISDTVKYDWGRSEIAFHYVPNRTAENIIQYFRILT